MDMLNIAFAVPESIKQGLADGTLKRVGGVIMNGSGKGVVAWLQDTGIELAQRGDGLPAEAGEMLKGLGASIQALPALQIANLAVSAAGFAAVLSKLNKLDRKLDTVLDRLKAIGQDVRWVRDVFDADLLSRVRAAARQLSLPVLNEPNQRRAVLRDLIEVSEALDARRELLLTNGRALAEGQLFDVYSDYLGHCIGLQLSTCWQLGDAGSAIMVGRDWTERLRVIADRLQAPVRAGTRDVNQLATFATLSEDQRTAASAANATLHRTATAVQQQVERVALFDAHGIGSADLAAIDAKHPGRLVLLQLPGGQADRFAAGIAPGKSYDNSPEHPAQ